MDCETAKPLLEALCDDELDVASAAHLVAHLDGCETCAALSREAETRKAALREARPVDRIPDDLRARLVREMGRSAPRRRLTTLLAGSLAASGLLAGGLAIGFARRERSQRPPALSESPVVREVTGEVFCLRCALSLLLPDTPVRDERHRPVLRTDEGDVVTLLDGAVTRAVLSQKGCAGRRVALTIRYFQEQELAEVLSARLIDPASSGRSHVAAVVPGGTARDGSARR